MAEPEAGTVAALSALYSAARWAELESRVERLIESHPASGLLRKFIGAARSAQGKDAVEQWQAALRLLPNDASAYTGLGNAHRARGQLREALRAHRRAIELKPDFAEAHNNAGAVLRELGQSDEAIVSYRRAVSLKADFALAHQNLGCLLQEQGRHQEALASHRRALAVKPDFADAHLKLGNAQRALGDADDAVTSYRRAIGLQPALAEALVNLGDVLFEQKLHAEAIDAYRQALKWQPGSVRLCNNLGNALREVGEIEGAVGSFRRAIELEPSTAELHNNLGNALFDLGRLEEAAQSYRRALELKPDYGRAFSNLGSALRELGRFEEAEASFREALALQPDSGTVFANLGVLKRLLGETAESESSLRRAVELSPHDATPLNSLADLLADRGQFAEAEELYRRAHSLEPQAARAWAGIAGLRKMTHADGEWLENARRLSHQTMRPRDEALLQYALGKYFDDTKDYAEAFGHFFRANEVAKTYSPPHDQHQFAGTFEFIAKLYDLGWLAKAQERANPSTLPIFVVGMPRSGTSLAEQILASHAKVHGAGELSFWKLASTRVGTASLQEQPVANLVAEVAAEYLSMLAALAPGAERVIDKMPGNFAHLGMINAALPQARIIHMRRNPIDTCLSIYFQNFQVTHTYSRDLSDIAHYYMLYQHLMQHWHSVLPPGRILEVPYEALVDDPESWSRKMVDFVGLDWDPACLDFHATRRSVSTFSKWQVRQKINKGSVERWRNYSSFIGPLLPLAEAAS